MKTVSAESDMDKGIDGICAVRFRHSRTCDRREGPMILVFGAFRDPAAEKVALLLVKLLGG